MSDHPEIPESTYDSVLTELSKGEKSLKQIAKDHGISDEAVKIKAWREDDFGSRYTRAWERNAHARFDRLIDLQDEAAKEVSGKCGKIVDGSWVQWRRLQIDTLKWELSKRCPKVYGDKMAHTGADGSSPVGIQIISSVPRPPDDDGESGA